MKARIRKLVFEPGRRIIVISDIHGNLPYLRGLLEKLRFCGRDYLVFDGDMLEKGEDSLGTLRFIMELCRGGNVFAVCGNCDGWHTLLRDSTPEMDRSTLDYIANSAHGWHAGLLRQMCDETGLRVTPDSDLGGIKRALEGNYGQMFDFLDSLPHVIETPDYTFVHGGLSDGAPETWDAAKCMKNDDFMGQGRSFDKWVIVGHWPVMLYGGGIVCANPIIDRQRHIISIDGGCVLKDDGQLNGLIIPCAGSEDFSWEYYDAFPRRRALTAQTASEKSWYIRWGDNRVRVLRHGEEFCMCEHKRTGYRMEILTKYLTPAPEGDYITNDCTDYRLPVEPGDELSIIEETSRGVFAKKNGVSGWYFGEI